MVKSMNIIYKLYKNREIYLIEYVNIYPTNNNIDQTR